MVATILCSPPFVADLQPLLLLDRRTQINILYNKFSDLALQARRLRSSQALAAGGPADFGGASVRHFDPPIFPKISSTSSAASFSANLSTFAHSF